MVLSFYKGDDFNAFLLSWLEGLVLLLIMGDMGMAFTKEKDHIECGSCEHERCYVDLNGYHGSLARRIGACIIAEPQGSTALDLSEIVATAEELRGSLIARRCNVETALAARDAMLMCFFSSRERKMKKVPGNIAVMLGTSPASGGYGSFYRWVSKHGRPEPERVRTRARLVGDRFREFGTAGMTDPILRLVVDAWHPPMEKLMEVRESMILESIIPTFGGVGLGKRKRDNAWHVVRVSEKTKFNKDRQYMLGLRGEFELTYQLWSAEFGKLLSDTDKLRSELMLLPKGVIQSKISQSGLVSQELAMVACGAEKPSHLWRALSGGNLSSDEHEILNATWAIERAGRKAMAMFIFSGGPKAAFWKESEAMSGEVAALVRDYAFRKWILSGADNVTNCKQTCMKESVIGELSVTAIARRLWLDWRTELMKIIY
jgi:hypothetical protein